LTEFKEAPRNARRLHLLANLLHMDHPAGPFSFVLLSVKQLAAEAFTR
jgi:hypothetical protein